MAPPSPKDRGHFSRITSGRLQSVIDSLETRDYFLTGSLEAHEPSSTVQSMFVCLVAGVPLRIRAEGLK